MKRCSCKKSFRMPIIFATIIYLITIAGCATTACDQAQRLRWKAMRASTESEKEYYESQARLYDENCAKENDTRYQQEKDRQMRGGRK